MANNVERGTYVLTFKGFDGSTDETDNLVRWVYSPSRRVISKWIEQKQLLPHLQEFEKMEDDEGLTLTLADGVDILLREEDGEILETRAEPEATPEYWINLSLAARGELV
jgi:hypothetical protein